MNGWRPGEAGCQLALSTLLPVGDRKLATVFLFPQIPLTISPLCHSHIPILSISFHSAFPFHLCALFSKQLQSHASYLILTTFICKSDSEHKHTYLFLSLMNLFVGTHVKEILCGGIRRWVYSCNCSGTNSGKLIRSLLSILGLCFTPWDKDREPGRWIGCDGGKGD